MQGSLQKQPQIKILPAFSVNERPFSDVPEGWLCARPQRLPLASVVRRSYRYHCNFCNNYKLIITILQEAILKKTSEDVLG